MLDFICFFPLTLPCLVRTTMLNICMFYVLFALCLYALYAICPSCHFRHFSLHYLPLLLFLHFIFYFPHTIHPCNTIRLLRLTGDSQYLSRVEMMSTQHCCLQNSIKTLFPCIAPRSHNTPTHHTASIHSPVMCFSAKSQTSFALFINFNLLILLHLSDTLARCAFSLNMNFSLHIWYLFLFLLLFIAHLFAFSSNIFGLELCDVLLTHSRLFVPYAHIHFTYKLGYTN